MKFLAFSEDHACILTDDYTNVEIEKDEHIKDIIKDYQSYYSDETLHVTIFDEYHHLLGHLMIVC